MRDQITVFIFSIAVTAGIAVAKDPSLAAPITVGLAVALALLAFINKGGN